MHVFESLLALLFAANLLSVLGRRLGVPYPTVLAIGGAVIAFLPGAPRLDLPAELIMALFVAPVLLDAAYDASLRDLKRSWLPVTSLVLVAVGLTTLTVAVLARLMFPDMSWAVAIVLGALVAPPDAVAALAVLRQAQPPHRTKVILEGESLLNDASALLIYRLAIAAALAGGFDPLSAAPAFGLVFVGSVAVGWLLAWPVAALMSRVEDASTSVILQFVVTFAVWLLAERLQLSGVVTIVVFGLTLARRHFGRMPARLRVPSFAIWETATMVLNVLAFTLIGLQLGPIWSALGPERRGPYLLAALAILAAVILVRLAWVLLHHGLDRGVRRLLGAASDEKGAPTVKDALAVGWSGMRGIVTLAAALAVPPSLPYRDFILLTAFVVVLGTLVLQGLTLGPLLQGLALANDGLVAREVTQAREQALGAAVRVLDGELGVSAERLRAEGLRALERARLGGDATDHDEDRLRRRMVQAARAAIEDMRRSGKIGDDAFRRIEEELDWRELALAAAP